MEERRGASASRPYVIAEFLHRLESFGMTPLFKGEPQQEAGYTLDQHVPASTYLNLLLARGFSTFRKIEERQDENGVDGRKDYAQILADIRALVADAGEDRLEIDVYWTAHQVNPEQLLHFPLYSRFTGVTDYSRKLDPPARALITAYRTEYEIDCSISITPHGPDEDQFADMGKKLNQQGALHDTCLAVQFGTIPRGSPRPVFLFTPNLSWSDAGVQDRQVAEIAWYLALLKKQRSIGSDVNSSNTQTLLDVALKFFSKPCIFTYQIGAGDFGISHVTARDYEEFRFLVPAPPNIMQRESGNCENVGS